MQSKAGLAVPTSALADIAAALGESISPCDRLAHWTLRWTLAHGQLTCNRCHASQATRQASEPFAHRSACLGAAGQSYPLPGFALPESARQEFPLLELSELLERLPRQPTPTANDWQTGRPR